jgi:hypothetical protein
VHRYAKEIMKDMGGVDVAASLEFFMSESRGVQRQKEHCRFHQIATRYIEPMRIH